MYDSVRSRAMFLFPPWQHLSDAGLLRPFCRENKTSVTDWRTGGREIWIKFHAREERTRTINSNRYRARAFITVYWKNTKHRSRTIVDVARGWNRVFRRRWNVPSNSVILSRACTMLRIRKCVKRKRQQPISESHRDNTGCGRFHAEMLIRKSETHSRTYTTKIFSSWSLHIIFCTS